MSDEYEDAIQKTIKHLSENDIVLLDIEYERAYDLICRLRVYFALPNNLHKSARIMFEKECKDFIKTAYNPYENS